MATKLYEMLGKDCLALGHFGIEMEVENLKDYETVKGWRCVEEASLHNSGIEYVSRKPMEFKKLRTFLNNLHEYIEAAGGEFNENCSVHVHVNCLPMTADQIECMALLSALLEPYLIHSFCYERYGSPFAVMCADSTAACAEVARHVRNLHYGDLPDSDCCRYAATNLVALGRFGTIEYRAMHGTSDPDELLAWITALYEIQLAAHEMQSDEILRLWKTYGASGFLSRVIPVTFTLLGELTDQDIKELKKGVNAVRVIRGHK